MQDQIQQVLEQQLRDVHLPNAVSWWPLAPGWWGLLLLLIIGSGIATLALLRKRKRNRYRKAALSELQSIYAQWQDEQNSATYLQDANAILKRCLLHFSDDKSPITQTGKAWQASLNAFSKHRLSSQALHGLSSACYQANPDVDIEKIHPQIERWIKSHRHSEKKASASPQSEPKVTHA